MAPFIFGVLIFGGGAAMMGLHWDTNFKQKFQELSEEERRFRTRQYYRRMITSGMITIVGILFVIYNFLPPDSIVRLWLMAIVLLLVLTIFIFAMIDVSAISQLYRLERKKSANATRDLADEFSRLKKKAREKKKNESSKKSDSDS